MAPMIKTETLGLKLLSGFDHRFSQKQLFVIVFPPFPNEKRKSFKWETDANEKYPFFCDLKSVDDSYGKTWY